MNAQTDNQMTITYENLVDQWIVDAVAKGVDGFWHLVGLLPGVYPSVALDSVRRLAAKGQVTQSSICQAVSLILFRNGGYGSRMRYTAGD